jgi:rhodanese-related sulfurtransferase
MIIETGREREPGGGETARGALLMLAAGIALGVAWNALHLARRPPGGLPWVARPQAVARLGTLEPPAGVALQSDTVATLAPRPTPGAPPRAAARPTNPAAYAQAATGPAAADPAPPPAVAAPAPASTPPVIPDVAGPLTIELPAFKQLYDANAALVVDAREPVPFAEGHIAGAISLPYNGALADPDRIAGLEPAHRAIVVYCSGGKCELAIDLAKFLVESGKRKVLVYQGGYPEWQAAGYPVARGMAEGARP